MFWKRKIKLNKEGDVLSFLSSKSLAAKEILVALYFSRFKKRFFGGESGSFDELIEEIEEQTDLSYHYIWKILKKLEEIGVLEYDRSDKKTYYFVNQEKIFTILEQEPIFNNLIKIIKDKYFMVKK